MRKYTVRAGEFQDVLPRPDGRACLALCAGTLYFRTVPSHFDLSEHPHRRLNLLTDEWILVSPHRAKRPWQGRVELVPASARLPYDPDCYLCPGNERAGGSRNPSYTDTFVFDNDFGALLPGTSTEERNDDELLRAQGEPGICRVVCFSSRHDLTLAEMSNAQIVGVIDVWTEEYGALAGRPYVRYVQIFENKGEVMGCSNPHPHGQIWAEHSIPEEPTKETRAMRRHRQERGGCLLCDYVRLELRLRERIICENEAFVVLVPFWAVWPFETMVLPRRHVADLRQLSGPEREAFADILHRITVRYDNLFQVSFPYSSGIHQAPTDEGPYPEWHLHMHFFPPLLRSATVKKFMVGYEMLANPQRDITPESSALRLREMPEIHFAAGQDRKHDHGRRT
jgi:UDPglucose--hexose-1-phosphate uridylyltransferase